MYVSIYVKGENLFFYINLRPPIKTKEKGLTLIENFILYSLRNIKAIKTVIFKIVKT